MSIRKAYKAGSWYAGDDLSLRREVWELLREAGEGISSPNPGPGRPVAVVVPHAGLAYSGGTAALAYHRLRQACPKIDCFVVFGASHRSRLKKPAVWAAGEWECPAGCVGVDEKLAALLIDDGVAEANETAHVDDNAIELQIPFIRVLFPEAAIVPIAMAPFDDSWRIGQQARAAAEKRGGNVLAIASTDLTHYGQAFGVFPAGAGKKALDWARQNDRPFLDALLALELENIVPSALRDGSACGPGAAAAAAGWAKAAGCAGGRLLAHTNSNDVNPDVEPAHFVDYASIIYEV